MTLICHRDKCGNAKEVKRKGERPVGWNAVILNGSNVMMYCERHYISVDVKDKWFMLKESFKCRKS